MIATRSGIPDWGTDVEFAGCGIGDLGGWGLDLVTLWADYKNTGSSLTITQRVNQNLGDQTGSSSSFSYSDLVADADAWLIGRQMETYPGIPVDEAVRQHVTSYSGSPSRIANFLNMRFTNNTLSSAIAGVFSFWPWNAFPRSKFMDGAPDPTSTELAEVQSAVATRLTQLS